MGEDAGSGGGHGRSGPGIFFFPILIDCAGNTKGGASNPKGGKRVTARPEVPPLFSAFIRHHALRRQCSLARVPIRRSAWRRASCLPAGGRRETMSGRGGVGPRKRPRLASCPAVPASLAGCLCQARGAGSFHLAGARDQPRDAAGKLGRKSVPIFGSARRFLHPRGSLGRISPGPRAPGATALLQSLEAAAVQPQGCCCGRCCCGANRTRPAGPGGGRWYWGRHPLRGWRRIFSHTFSS